MKVTVGAASDIGRVREGNEDSYLVLDPLFAVADGMGGHLGGEVASNLALDTIRERFSAGEGSLADQVASANRAVFERSQRDREVRGMGTTLTAALVEGARIRLVHVGDSRAYLLRGDELHMLTKDHTVVAQMVEDGEITAAEAETHPHRNIVTRVLGVESDVEVDEGVLDARDGDRLLLCSDGLTGMVSQDEVARILREVHDPQEAVERLVAVANEAGGVDNITCVLLDVHDVGAGSGDEATAAVVATGVPTETPTQGTPVASAARTATATATLSVPTPTSSSAPRRGRPRTAPAPPASRRLRTGLWVGVTVVVLVLGFLGLRLFLDSQWFVGVSNGRVAIFRGVPSEVAGIELHSVVVETSIDADAVAELPVWRELPNGITVTDREAAHALVDDIAADLAQAPDRT